MTVIPSKHTFTIWRGATFSESLVVYSDMAGTVPFCNSAHSYTAEMIIRTNPDGEELISVTATVDVPNSTINLSLTPAETADLAWSGAVYDLTITDTTANPDVTNALLYGAIKVQGV